LAAECRERGVKLLTRTPAKKILLGAKGSVTGVLAETKGEEFTITTKSVIIASGGYGGNRELLKKYYPYYNDNLRCGGIPHTGDGLLMAMEIGAATEGLGLLIGGGLPGAERAPMELGEPYLVRVNQKGERFIDETVVGAQHTFFGSDTMPASYILFDHKILQYMMEHGTIVLTPPHRLERYVPLPGLEKELRKLADKGLMKISDSWDEIAEYIGCDPKALKATIEEYNTFCNQGYDPIFAKERRYLMPLRTPPYYAIGGSSRGLLDTVGGIKINEHMEVLDKQDNPIPGLYAAGVCAGGWQAIGYCGVYTSGAAVGFAINSGRIAGENAVKFARGK
jgi:fumarate reductase flavoprotein subunit